MNPNNKFHFTIPVNVRWILLLCAIYLSIFTLFRILIICLFKESSTSVSSLFPSFWLGFKFDCKWIAILLMPMAVISMKKQWSPFYSEFNRLLWSVYLSLTTLFVLFFFIADLVNFGYNHTRINASALNFAEDFKISFQMLWESYPMLWILVGLLVVVWLIHILFKHLQLRVSTQNKVRPSNASTWNIALLVLLVWCISGIFSFHILKWKEAFNMNDNFKSYLSLNPLQNFFTTLKFRNATFDGKEVSRTYTIISRFLRMDSNVRKEYVREIKPLDPPLSCNVVLVICESFSMYKSSMSGNPLNSTPYFKQLADSGLFFDHCFSPTFGTARGVFNIITGIPDVQLSKFSTRSPEAIHQRTIINNFDGYDKMYFLGGSSDFNNFQGLVENIKDVKIYQQGSYSAKPLNVWGISDENLFLEANKVFEAEQHPFFAIIQTADNHHPYDLPEGDSNFIKRIVDKDSLKEYGFESLKEFQAFCYSDYCFQKFIETARRQPYFKNTLFVFAGDHGVEGQAGKMYPAAWTANRLSAEHIPLLFYHPGLLKPERRKEVVSQIDILPTIAGMLHKQYTNSTLGRDLLGNQKKENAAFIIHHDEGNIGLVTDDYYFVKNIRIQKEQLIPISPGVNHTIATSTDTIRKKLSILTSAIFETARWMLIHNKPK